MTTVSNSTAAPSSTGVTNQADVGRLNQNFDDFLRLLTTQLQNQDPLSPMDTAEFTNQLVMFSQVEQQLRSNDTLNKLLTMQTLNMTALGVSFIGKDVQVAGEEFASAGGGKPVNLSYTLGAAATDGTISITDANDNIIYTANAEKSAGTHNFTWNGMDKDGNPVAAGTYKLTVSAQNAEGDAIDVTGFVPGHVSGLQTADDGTLMLIVNGETVPMTDVRQISEPTA
jgi:flagellar basal-body rod modification protein FlgD